MKKLAIFGATGRTGIHLVEQALAREHEVTVLARNPDKLGELSHRVRTVQGDVTDPGKVAEAVQGQDAVIMALGHTRTSPKDVLTVATRNVLEAMNQHGVRRLINLTGAGVPDPADKPGLFDRLMSGLLRLAARDLWEDAMQQTSLIRASDLDWTIVRVPRLTNGPARGTVRSGYVGHGPGPMISRADVATFMLEQVTSDEHKRKAPAISE